MNQTYSLAILLLVGCGSQIATSDEDAYKIALNVLKNKSADVAKRRKAAIDITIHFDNKWPSKDIPADLADVLLATLDEQDPILVETSAFFLSNRRFRANSVVPKLLLRFKPASVDSIQQTSMVTALGFFGEDATVAIPIIVDAFSKSQDFNLRRAIIKALANIDSTDKAVQKLLLAALSDESLFVRVEAAALLCNNETNKAKVIDVLRQGLTSGDIGTRKRTTYLIGERRVTQPAVYDELLKRLNDDIPQIRSAASEAIGKIVVRPDVTINALLTRLQAENEDHIRNDLFEAIGLFREDAKPYLPKLLKQSYDGPLQKAGRILAVARISLDYTSAIAILAMDARHDNPAYREAAVYSLGCIGPKARECLPLLRQLARNDECREVKREAEMAIKKIARD